MSGEGFLSRWSRRKRAAEAGAPVEEPAPASPAIPVMPAAPAPAQAAEPEFDPATLPPVETLTAGSDFTAFLRKEVPEALKRAALRKAWTLDPAIRDFVGLADYDWDFNAPDGITGFALELGGDAERLLAQAVGLDRHDPPAAETTPPVAPDAAPPDEPEPPAPAMAAETAPSLVAEATDPPAEPTPPPRQRHGSAVPS
jgi:hypothetical protein